MALEQLGRSHNMNMIHDDEAEAGVGGVRMAMVWGLETSKTTPVKHFLRMGHNCKFFLTVHELVSKYSNI